LNSHIDTWGPDIIKFLLDFKQGCELGLCLSFMESLCTQIYYNWGRVIIGCQEVIQY